MANGSLKEKIQTKAEEQITSVAVKQKDSIGALLEKMKPEIERALPKHMNAERLLRIALTNIRLNPKLQQCSQVSLLAAIMQSAQLGLEPGLLGQAYLIPYQNRKLNTTECQFQIGYKGLIELARRSGQINTIFANEVRENDSFDYEYGLQHKLIHKPLLKGDRGQVICYYAYSILKDGGTAFYVMSIEDIKRIRDEYSKSKDYGPWITEFDAMAKKTVLKQLMKFLPLSVEIQKNIIQDETVKTEISESMVDILDNSILGPDYVENDMIEES